MKARLATRLAFTLALVAALGVAGGAATPAPDLSKEEARLLRFPALSRDSVAFVYAGDLWVAPRGGGIARQITTDAGLEWFPRFSPDGKWIAFTGEYDGNREVYVVPAEGGEPKRLTWWMDVGQQSERSGPNNMVIGWTPDGGKILFRSRHMAWESRAGRLYTIGLDGGLPEPLVVPEGGLASFSPDGGKIVYNRIFRNFRTWKRYRGGMTQNLWIYDLKANALEKLTENDNTSTDPMWIGERIYFTSDRERTANIFVIDVRTKQTRKLTNHTEYDVRWASDGPGGIVYENGGFIYVLDTGTEKTQKISVRIPGDRILTRPQIVGVSDKITEYGLGPEGKRACIVARGEIFTVPAEKGDARNLTNTAGAREKGASWSPDGRWIAYLSDGTGEDEIWIAPQDGKTAPHRLTTDGQVLRFGPVWSPDSKKIAFSDKDLKLYVLDVETRKTTFVDKAEFGEILDHTWSPDSRWLAWSKPNIEGFSQVYMCSLETGKVTRVTSEMNDSSAPAFDPNGRYLYFLSNRDLNPAFGAFDFSYVYNRPTKLYAVTLRADLPSPFAPESDEVKPAEEKKEGDKKEETAKEAEKKGPEPIKVDLDGIEERIAVFPMQSGNYDSLRPGKGVIFYMSRQPGGDAAPGGPPPSEIRAFDLEKRKDATFMEGVNDYDLSPDGSKLIYRSQQTYGIVDAKAGTTPKVGDGPLSLSGLQMKLDPRTEWRQIFNEVWRRQRDSFYVANLHGVNWNEMKDRYGALLPHVAHRSDLTYVLGEMIGELNVGHTYVGGGAYPQTRSVPIGMLGADYELDAATGRYRIAKVLQGQNWFEQRRSPLTEPGASVAAGSYVLKIDGVELKAPATPDQLLENKAGKIVTLLVNEKPAEEGAREFTVRPIGDEENLRYYDQIEANRRKVEAATNGRVGYVHIPDMSPDGLNEFVRQYYPQIRKEGLIVDARNNGGGFVSQLIIERLRRVLAGMGSSRNTGISTYPAQVFYGPMVCLINHYSASDGDIFPYYFRKYGLGKLIGTRTWGGVVGIRGFLPLVDGGYFSVPEFAEYDLEPRWAIEGVGVEPDIEVDNRDDLVVKGRDPQLEKAIEVLKEEINRSPKKLPEPPPPPVKTGGSDTPTR